MNLYPATAEGSKPIPLLTTHIGGFILLVLTDTYAWFLMLLPVWIFMGVACAGIGARCHAVRQPRHIHQTLR